MNLNAWDKEILKSLSSRKSKEEAKALRKEYKKLRGEGLGPESILDELSGQSMDTRWIYWLKTAKKHLDKGVL